MAPISDSLMRDEYSVLFLCNEGSVCTVKIHHDRFLADEDIAVRGLLSRAHGNIQAVRQDTSF